MLLRMIVSVIVSVFIGVNAFGMTVLYKADEELFQNSSLLLQETFQTTMPTPMSTFKEDVLEDIRQETETLYILTHGWPRGVNITAQVVRDEEPTDVFITWDELAQNVRANTLIVDSCFSGRILDVDEWESKPSLIITSTTSDNYSFNPELVENFRASLLSFSFFLYFGNGRIVQKVENLLDIKMVHHYTPIFMPFTGIQGMMEDLKESHFRLYTHFGVKELNHLLHVTRNLKYPFKGFSTIEFEIGD